MLIGSANVCTDPTVPTHPRGSRARLLLTSVFGPYAIDDQYGSRHNNPMELYHNQVTREQGAYSLRMFHRSWGILMIRENLDAPCAVLDFPSRDRFVEELKLRKYDVIGISAIQPNLDKVREMCRLIRLHQPDATIVVGGHVSGIADLDNLIDADHIVRGEGVRWMQAFLGEDTTKPFRHPRILSGLGTRSFGINTRDRKGDVAATVLPSVGCPMGCNFCATSAMFGGKGKFVHFWESGDELFEIMCDLERTLGVRSFFMMDENFLLHKKRALRVLELMEQNGKAWALYVFSSANVIRTYTIDQLVRLGISWVWMGLEGEDSIYKKLRGINTRDLVRDLQSHGIRVLGSTIIGLEDHTPDRIDGVINYAVDHDTEFHQFMLYTPVAGTPLYDEHRNAGTLLSAEEVPEAERHGQDRFCHRHPNIPPGDETSYLRRAFQLDFNINGPSVARVARTILQGWRRYKNHPDLRVRDRFKWEARDLPVKFAAALWAAKRRLRKNREVRDRIGRTLKEVYREFGLKARIAGPMAGRYVLRKLKKEQRRLAKGWTYEPPTFYEPGTERSG